MWQRLRRLVNATRWPEGETVTDNSQGVPLAMIRDLARYWGTGYDWSKPHNRCPAGHGHRLLPG